MKEKVIEIFKDLEEYLKVSLMEANLGLPPKSISRAWVKGDLPEDVINHFTGLVQKWAIVGTGDGVQKKTNPMDELNVQILTVNKNRITALEAEVQRLNGIIAQYQTPEKGPAPAKVENKRGERAFKGSMRAFLGIQEKPPYNPSQSVKKAFKE